MPTFPSQPAAPPHLLTAVLAAALIGAALLARRWLGPAVVVGVAASALTWSACLAALAQQPHDGTTALRRTLIALTGWWIASAHVASRARAPVAATVVGVLSQSALVCWIAAAGCWLGALAGDPTGRDPAAAWDLAALAALPILERWLRRARAGGVRSGVDDSEGAGAMLPWLAGLGLAGVVVEAGGVGRHPDARPWLAQGIIVGAAALALTGMLGLILLDWRRRVRAWLTHPERLVERVRPPAPLRGAVGAIGAAVLVAGAAHPGWPLGPIGMFLASLACFILVHRAGPDHEADGTPEPRIPARPLRSPAVANLAMLLVAGTTVTAATAWLPRGWFSPGAWGVAERALLGVALSGMHLLWLAEFWRQQLLNESPWTTAGRLIPVARRIAQACVIVGAAIAVAMGLDGTGRPAWIVGGAALALASWRTLREAAGRGVPAGQAVGWAGLSAGVWSTGVALGRGAGLPELWIPIAGVVAAVVLVRAAARTQDAGAAVAQSMLGGWFAVSAVMTTAVAAWHAAAPVRLLVAGGGVLLLAVGAWIGAGGRHAGARAG